MSMPHPSAIARPASAAACPVCASPEVTSFIELAGVPVHCNLLWPTRAGALGAPRGDMALGYCAACAHIYNYAFDPALTAYTQSYENSLHFSARFQHYADELVAHLIARYDLHGKDIIEIGCGKGDFLRQLCHAGDNRGLGFDRSYVPEPSDAADPAVRFVLDFFGERYAHEPADLIVCRHVLEHIERPLDFLADIRSAIAPERRPVLYFEVPNALWTLRDLGIWDLIYEHCSYFSPGSLAHTFEAADFEVLALRESFGGQFLSLEAVPTTSAIGATAHTRLDFARMGRDVAAFAESYRAKVAHWRGRLDELAQRGQRAVVWGAGSKGVTFLNTLRAQSAIAYVVDLNPRKQGMFVAGTSQMIVAPAFLSTYRPEVVIVMNALYADEIRQLLDELGVAASVECA